MTATEWPSALRETARPEPTRPHPTTITCTPQCNTPARVAQKWGGNVGRKRGAASPDCVCAVAIPTASRPTAPSARPSPAEDIPETRRYRLKNRLLGPPLVTEQLATERLSRPIALGRAGAGLHLVVGLRHRGDADPAGALRRAWPPSPWSCPITLAILGVLFFVTLSYLEVIQLYTKAGGSYVVARDNFGPRSPRSPPWRS